MSNTFDFNRFGKLVKYDFFNMLQSGLPFILLSAAALAGIWIISIVACASSSEAFRFIILCITTYLALIMNTSYLYGKVNLPKRGIPSAMLPASKCEKFWSMMLYSLVVVPACCFAAGLAADTLLYLLPLGGFDTPIWKAFPSSNYNFDTSNVAVRLACAGFIATFVSSLINNHAQFFFTNTIFKRHKIIFTFVALWVIGMAISTIGVPILTMLDIDNSNWIIRWFEGMATSNPDRAYTIMFAIGIGINLLMATGLYTWSYFRIKNAKY